MAAGRSKAVARALALEHSEKLAQASGNARPALECSIKLTLAHGHGDDGGVGGLTQALDCRDCSTSGRSRAQLEEAEHRVSPGFPPGIGDRSGRRRCAHGLAVHVVDWQSRNLRCGLHDCRMDRDLGSLAEDCRNRSSRRRIRREGECNPR